MISPPLHQEQPLGFGPLARATDAVSPRAGMSTNAPSLSTSSLPAVSSDFFAFPPLPCALSMTRSSVSTPCLITASPSRSSAPRSSSAIPAMGPAGDFVRMQKTQKDLEYSGSRKPRSSLESRSTLTLLLQPRDSMDGRQLSRSDDEKRAFPEANCPPPLLSVAVSERLSGVRRGDMSPVDTERDLGLSPEICEAPLFGALSHPHSNPTHFSSLHSSAVGAGAPQQHPLHPEMSPCMPSRTSQTPLQPSGSRDALGVNDVASRPSKAGLVWSSTEGRSSRVSCGAVLSCTAVPPGSLKSESWLRTLSPGGLDEQASLETSASSARVEKEFRGLWDVPEAGQVTLGATGMSPSRASPGKAENSPGGRRATPGPTFEAEQESPWAHLVRDSNQPFAPVIGHYVEGFTSSSSGSSTSISPSPSRSPVRRRVGRRAPGDPVVGDDPEVSWYPARARKPRRPSSGTESSSTGEELAPESGLFGVDAGNQFMQLSRALLGGDGRSTSESSDADSEVESQRLEQQQLLQELRLRTLGVGAERRTRGRASANRRATGTAGTDDEASATGPIWRSARMAETNLGDKEWGSRGDGRDASSLEREGRRTGSLAVSDASSMSPRSAGGCRRLRDASGAEYEGPAAASRIRRGRSMHRKSRGRQAKEGAPVGPQSSLGLQFFTEGSLFHALLFGDPMFNAEGLRTDDSDVSSGPEPSPSPVVVPVERPRANKQAPQRTRTLCNGAPPDLLEGMNRRRQDSSRGEACADEGETGVSEGVEGGPWAPPRRSAHARRVWNGITSTSPVTVGSGTETPDAPDPRPSRRGGGAPAPRGQRQLVRVPGRVLGPGLRASRSVTETEDDDPDGVHAAGRKGKREGLNVFALGSSPSSGGENSRGDSMKFMTFFSQFTGQGNVSADDQSPKSEWSSSRESSVSARARGASEDSFKLSPKALIVSEELDGELSRGVGVDRSQTHLWGQGPRHAGKSGSASVAEPTRTAEAAWIGRGYSAHCKQASTCATKGRQDLLDGAVVSLSPRARGACLEPGLLAYPRKEESSALPSQRPSLAGTTASGVSSKRRLSDGLDWELTNLSRRSSQTFEHSTGGTTPIQNLQRPQAGKHGCLPSGNDCGAALPVGACDATHADGVRCVSDAKATADPRGGARTAEGRGVNGVGGVGLSRLREAAQHPLGVREERRDTFPRFAATNAESTKSRTGDVCEEGRHTRPETGSPSHGSLIGSWGGGGTRRSPGTSSENAGQTETSVSVVPFSDFPSEASGTSQVGSRHLGGNSRGHDEVQQRTLRKANDVTLGQELCDPGDFQGKPKERSVREERGGLVDRAESSGSFISPLSSLYSAWGFS
ncbi:putative RNase protein H [Toxoplasma gondii p89]|uniref:Putative RNase protein H n=1 Tax=Toxoplasma gondii p89 TaxID=943119 RepID=A0A086J865_TOXGO|nr:putative RNase protein H [Toxoplasma gondii p89]